jgi:hypothetical protein
MLLPAGAVQIALEDDQIFLHIGELESAAARAQGASTGQMWYMPSQVGQQR